VRASVIEGIVADHFGVSVRQMESVAQADHIVRARQTAMYFLREFTDLRIVEIASMFSRTHSTVVNATAQTLWRMRWELGFADIIETLRNACKFQFRNKETR
jgi:chromosomal replication initiation ATPase DnaA